MEELEGYKKELHLFNLRNINVCALLLFFVTFVAGTLIFLFATDCQFVLLNYIWLDIIIAIVFLVVGVIVHELMHALMAIVVGKVKPKDIKLGVKLRDGIFYCNVSKPVTAGAYKVMLIVPIIVTGVIPWVMCAVFGNLFFIAAASLLIAGGASDVLMFSSLVKTDNKQLIMDHEDAAAYYLLVKETDVKEGFVEATPENESELLKNMEAENMKRDTKMILVRLVLIAVFLAVIILGLFGIAKLMQFI